MSLKYLIFLIFLAGALLRLINLGAGDPMGDEVLYAFRAVGPLDFDEAEFQKTPLEWWDPNIPSWTKLSFHDHPPLVFWIQHLFMRIFGENTFAFRLPSALLGIFSIYLLYLIGRQLFSQNVGLLAAAIFAVTVNHVFISRVGLQESYVLFFVLLTVYFFLKALQEDKYLILTGLSLGLGLLTKYTTFIVVPIILTYLLIYRRDYFKNKKFWFGLVIALLIFSPVIIYNLKLYQAVGHFDFQISYILGQNPEIWKAAPGKEEIGTFTDRLRNFIPNLFGTNSWLFLLLFFGSLATLSKNKFLIITFIYLVTLLLFIGPAARFLTMLTPFIALSLAPFLILLFEKMRTASQKIGITVAFLFLAFETLYSINSQLLTYPKGSPFWLFSERIRKENYNWGYNELDKFLKLELKGKMPVLTFDSKYQFLEEIKNRYLDKAKEKGLKPYPALIVYDGNVYNSPQLWVLDRLQIYHGWPVINAQAYFTFLEERGEGYFEKSGLKFQYFIMPTDKVPLKKAERLTKHGALIEQNLIAGGLEPIFILNRRGEAVFKIYKFST